MMAITGPAELSAAATLINFWSPGISPAVWYTVFIVVIVMINFCGVRVYGEVTGLLALTFKLTYD